MLPEPPRSSSSSVFIQRPRCTYPSKSSSLKFRRSFRGRLVIWAPSPVAVVILLINIRNLSWCPLLGRLFVQGRVILLAGHLADRGCKASSTSAGSREPCRLRLPRCSTIQAVSWHRWHRWRGLVAFPSRSATETKLVVVGFTSPDAYAALGTWIRVSWQRRSKILKSKTPLNVSRT